jgi:hypothetical protein
MGKNEARVDGREERKVFRKNGENVTQFQLKMRLSPGKVVETKLGWSWRKKVKATIACPAGGAAWCIFIGPGVIKCVIGGTAGECIGYDLHALLDKIF